MKYMKELKKRKKRKNLHELHALHGKKKGGRAEFNVPLKNGCKSLFYKGTFAILGVPMLNLERKEKKKKLHVLHVLHGKKKAGEKTQEYQPITRNQAKASTREAKTHRLPKSN